MSIEYITLLSLFVSFSLCCLLDGNDSGDCLTREEILGSVSFCKDYIPSRVCVPYVQDLWEKDFSISSKDSIVEMIYIKNMQEKLIFEYETNTDNMSLSHNRNCYLAYKKFLCRWNFPLCTSRRVL